MGWLDRLYLCETERGCLPYSSARGLICFPKLAHGNSVSQAPRKVVNVSSELYLVSLNGLLQILLYILEVLRFRRRHLWASSSQSCYHGVLPREHQLRRSINRRTYSVSILRSHGPGVPRTMRRLRLPLWTEVAQNRIVFSAWCQCQTFFLEFVNVPLRTRRRKRPPGSLFSCQLIRQQ